MSRETILVVDDSEFILEFLDEQLGDQGFHVHVSPDGAEAMRLLEHEHVDLLLTDLNMPNVSGMELVKHVHEHYPDVTPVIMTGYASLETAREAIVYGVVDYIFKPFKSEEIIAAIENALERVRLRRENHRLREALTLSNASHEIASGAFHSADLLETIATAAMSQAGSQFAAVLVIDEDCFQFDLRYSNAPNLDDFGGCSIGSTFPPETFESATKEMLLVTVEATHPLSEQVRHVTLDEMQCPALVPIEQEALFVPLQANGKVKALLVLSKAPDTRHFAASDLPVVSVIANLGATNIENASLISTLEQTTVSTLISLNIILEAKHPNTKGHTQRVVGLCVALGRHLGLRSGDLQVLREGAMLHDIGKLAISDTILNKPGPLTDEEMEIVRQHPVIGDNIIRPIKFLQHYRPVVRHHHERWDGGGYPDGLKGDAIPFFARICTVADAVDAMASARSYRAALSFPEIYDQVLMGSGTQFDENLAKIMLGMIEHGEVTTIERPHKLTVG